MAFCEFFCVYANGFMKMYHIIAGDDSSERPCSNIAGCWTDSDVVRQQNLTLARLGPDFNLSPDQSCLPCDRCSLAENL